MFSKVFKYDFKYVFRYWWIFALITFGLSIAAGFLIRGLVAMEQAEIENFLTTFLGALGIIGVMIVICLFPFVSVVANLVRYYKNFFSDEGYLTFTLPVSRTTLLNSKVLCNFVFNFMSLVVLFLDIIMILLIGIDGFFNEIRTITNILPEFWSHWLTIDAILLPFLLMVSVFASIGMTYLSITIGSVISKRHKVITGIGVYLIFNAIMNFIQQMISYFTINPLLSGSLYFEEIGDSTASFTLYLLILTLFYTAVAIGTYCANLHCIKNKLNLA